MPKQKTVKRKTEEDSKAMSMSDAIRILAKKIKG